VILSYKCDTIRPENNCEFSDTEIEVKKNEFCDIRENEIINNTEIINKFAHANIDCGYDFKNLDIKFE